MTIAHDPAIPTPVVLPRYQYKFSLKKQGAKDRAINKLNQIRVALTQSERKLIKNQEVLAQKEDVLEKKKASIDRMSEKIQANQALIDDRKTEPDEQQRLIDEKNKVLLKQVSTIENQQVILVVGAIVLLLVLALIGIIFRSYRSKNRLNLQLKENSAQL